MSYPSWYSKLIRYLTLKYAWATQAQKGISSTGGRLGAHSSAVDGITHHRIKLHYSFDLPNYSMWLQVGSWAAGKGTANFIRKFIVL
jgi:hypothetical protein